MDDPKHLGVKSSNLVERTLGIGKSIKERILHIDYKGKKFKQIAGGVLLTLIILISGIGYRISTRAFEVHLGEDMLGTVRSEEDFMAVYKELEGELSKTYNMEVVLNSDIKFTDTHVSNSNLSKIEDIEETLKSKVSFLVQGYTLEIDGVKIGSLKTKEEVERLIDKIQEPFTSIEDGKSEKIVEVSTMEEIKIVMEEMPLYQLGTEEKLYDYLVNGGEEIRTHTVEVGESLWTIAQIYGVSVEELESANQDKDPTKLQIGDEVKLLMPKSMLTVETKSEVEYMEKIQYESIVEYDDSMFTNEKKVKVEGQNGLSKIVASEVKQNGLVVEKNVINEEVVEAPVSEVVIKGTKEVPKTAATGSFLMPTRGRISSRYGMRNGRMHKGLDISAKTGTPIKAADGGKVVFAGYSGAYGYLVEVDHGNGYRTKYAHCSKILVSVGTKVYKGQHIANVGNTGRSTGAHLHLEVLKNGANQNPSSYVK